VQFNARAIGEQAQGINEVQVLGFTNPRNLIARRATPKAVVATFFGIDRKRWRLFSVKRTETCPALAGSFQSHRFSDQRHEIRRRANLRDLIVGNGHRKKVPVLAQPRAERLALLSRLHTVSEFAVEALNIVKTYHNSDVRALDDVTLHVPTGQVFGLLGPNGSGKTTMVRILSTILAPTSGRATVAGFDVVKHPNQVRHNIGLAGQNATVDENLTGFENLRMVGLLNHLNKSFVVAKSNQLLRDFGLSDAANRITKTYSGGMRRRLDLAAALVADPPILFLDEPTTGLDPQSRQDLWGIIEGLVESGTTVLLTTQYLDEADRLAKQLVVLDHGTIIAEGTSAQLKTQMGTTVLSLSFASTSDALRAQPLIADLSSKPSLLEGTQIEMTVENGPSVTADALRRIDAAGVALSGLALREPSLDDVFLNLTGHKAEVTSATDISSNRRRRRRSHS
jgi:ABC-2 type transport system ATP-binding protein